MKAERDGASVVGVGSIGQSTKITTGTRYIANRVIWSRNGGMLQRARPFNIGDSRVRRLYHRCAA